MYPSPLFSPLFSGKAEKIGPPEAVHQNHPATSSLGGKEEAGTEDQRHRLRWLVLAWPFLTRRRRQNRVDAFWVPNHPWKGSANEP